MPLQEKALRSFSRILDLLRDLSRSDDLDQVQSKYRSFPTFAGHIAQLFMEDRLFDIIPRVQMELELVARYNPPVRPALDPYVSTQIGIFSKNFHDREIGYFLGYPECCIRPFTEETRYGLDERHEAELGRIKGKIFAATAGFIPHSVYCRSSLSRGLIAFVSQGELESMHRLEGEISRELPHFHPEYQGHYYELRFT